MAWLLRLQATASVLVAFAWALGSGVEPSLAALAGGAIGFVLTAVSALRAGLAASDGRPEVMVTAFYRGMALKLVLAVVLFVIVARWHASLFVPVLTGYMATVLAYWFALLRLGRAAS